MSRAGIIRVARIAIFRNSKDHAHERRNSVENCIDDASADTVRLQFRKFKTEDKTRKAKQSRSKRERAKKRKPRLNKKDEPVIREVIRDKDKRDINVSDELTFISRGIALS